MKAELDILVKRGVLVPVEEPTQWVSQMAVVREQNGKLRLCIDPQPLNQALLREHYKLATLDDVLPNMNNSKMFSKLDVQEAFWHVELDAASSLLTTMITPYGRYRWARLPFGLKVSSEVFQKKLNDALESIAGVICVADDIIVTGCGATKMLAERDHDDNLKRLQERWTERNIKLNNAKAEYKRDNVIFMGHKINTEGIQADDDKVKAILEMPSPTDIHGVKRFCGMIQYLARFMPDLATDLEPIRGLTRQGVVWNWSKQCEEAFKTVKRKITTTPMLAYIDSDKELVLQVDSSQDGLGVVMMQDGKPIEFTSRSLTPPERRWAQLEKELLSVVFGLERFDQYTFGRKVVIHNDHKPLAAILKKPLSQAPRRLQVLILRLYRYDVEFKYVEGGKLVIADTLSRAHLEVPETQVRSVCINVFQDIPDKKIQEVVEATQKDEGLQKVLDLIRNGWPGRKEKVPYEATPYFDIRDTLSHEGGVILKGQRIVIPMALRSEMKRRLHATHMSYDSMMARARDTIFWPRMSSEVKQLRDVPTGETQATK